MSKKFLKRKIIAGVVSAVCAASVVAGVSYAESVEDLNEQREQAENDLSDIEAQLSSILTEMNDIDVRASDIIADIYEADVQLDAEQEKHTQQYQDMGLRIKYMYENKVERIEESLISSKSMGEFLNSANYFQNIYSYDRDKLDEIEETQRQIEKLAATLQTELAQVEEAREERQDTREPERTTEEVRTTTAAVATTRATTQATTTARATQAATTTAARTASSQTARQTTQNNTSSSNTSSSAGKASLVAQYARSNNGTFPCTYGWCAAWVSGIYANAGVTPPHGNAIDYWNKWSYSGGTGKYNIPVGACVVSSGAGYLAQTYGHVGIYIGNGLVASNVGYLKIESIDSFDYTATATCQGHTGYIGWVWPNGIPLN